MILLLSRQSVVRPKNVDEDSEGFCSKMSVDGLVLTRQGVFWTYVTRFSVWSPLTAVLSVKSTVSRHLWFSLTPFATGNPFLGTGLLGISMGRGLGASKGLTFVRIIGQYISIPNPPPPPHRYRIGKASLSITMLLPLYNLVHA